MLLKRAPEFQDPRNVSKIFLTSRWTTCVRCETAFVGGNSIFCQTLPDIRSDILLVDSSMKRVAFLNLIMLDYSILFSLEIKSAS